MSLPRPLKIIGIIVVSGVALVCIAFAALFLMYPPAKLKQLALDKAKTVINRPVDIDKIGFTLFPTIGMRITGLTVANAVHEGFADTACISVGEFSVGVKLSSLVRGKVEAGVIRLVKPRLFLETDTGNVSSFTGLTHESVKNVDTIAPKKASGLPLLPIPLSVKTFEIVDGSVTVINHAAKSKIQIGSINEQLSFSADTKLEYVVSTGVLTLAQVSLAGLAKGDELTLPTVKLTHTVQVNMLSQHLQVTDLSVALGDCAVHVSGSIDSILGTPLFALTLATDTLSLKNLVALVPPQIVPEVSKLTAQGQLALKVSLTGLQDSTGLPAVEGSLKIDKGTIAYAGMPKNISNLDLDCRFSRNDLDLRALRFLAGANPVDIVARVKNFASPVVTARMQAKVNLDEVKDIVALAPGTSLAGQVSIDVSAQGKVDPADPTKLAMNGRVELLNVKYSAPSLMNAISCNGVITTTNKNIIGDCKVTSGSSDIAFKATVADYLGMIFPKKTGAVRTTCTIAMTSQTLKLSDFVKETEPVKNETKAVASSAAPTPLLAVPLPPVDTKAKVTIGTFQMKNLELKSVTADISVVNALVVAALRAQTFGGSIQSTSNVNAQNIKDIQVVEKASGTNVQVSELLKFTSSTAPNANPLMKELGGLAGSLTGATGFTLNATTHGATMDDLVNNMKADARTDISNGVWKKGTLLSSLTSGVDRFYKVPELSFRNMNMGVRIADKIIHLDKCSIASALVGDIDILGSLGFDTKADMNVAMKLTPQESQKLISAGNTITSAAKNLLSQNGLAAASGLVPTNAVPADNAVRVTLLVKLLGPLTGLKGQFGGFGAGSAASAAPAPSVQQQAKTLVVEKAQQELQKLEQNVIKNNPEAQKVKDAAEQLKSQGIKGLKKLF